MTLPAVPAVPSRRAVVRTALWSVPAISLATAAPAFADSGQPALEFVAGDTGVDWNGNLVLEGASVHAAGRSIAPAPVTMTMAYQLQTGGPPVTIMGPAPAGWVPTGPPSGNPLTFVSLTNIASGGWLPLPIGGRNVFVRIGGGSGTYHLTFSAPGYLDATASFFEEPV